MSASLLESSFHKRSLEGSFDFNDTSGNPGMHSIVPTPRQTSPYSMFQTNQTKAALFSPLSPGPSVEALSGGANGFESVLRPWWPDPTSVCSSSLPGDLWLQRDVCRDITWRTSRWVGRSREGWEWSSSSNTPEFEFTVLLCRVLDSEVHTALFLAQQPPWSSAPEPNKYMIPVGTWLSYSLAL